jgi:adenine deaminase
MLVMMPSVTVTVFIPAVNDPDTPVFSNAIVPNPETAIVTDPAALVMVMFAPAVSSALTRELAAVLPISSCPSL